MCVFLFRDGMLHVVDYTAALSFVIGTVITFHHDTKLQMTAPITERLRQRDTGLRATADASLLVQSLLDLGTSGLYPE